MPQTKKEGICFGIIMSILMAFGMEVYNKAWQYGYAAMSGGFANMENKVFLGALKEMYMAIFVFVLSEAFGNRIGHALAARITDDEKDSRFVKTLFTGGCTVLIMCPSMSLVAAILFSVILGGAPISQLPALWAGTLMKNFPMALLWNIFAAAPLTRLSFRLIFRRKKATHDQKELAAAKS
ncbi:MAG: hypothetical protein LUI06_05035 [Ruminococcus sp.]|nr:hypothetical protein [Ruminococcus sp.]